MIVHYGIESLGFFPIPPSTRHEEYSASAPSLAMESDSSRSRALLSSKISVRHAARIGELWSCQGNSAGFRTSWLWWCDGVAVFRCWEFGTVGRCSLRWT